MRLVEAALQFPAQPCFPRSLIGGVAQSKQPPTSRSPSQGLSPTEPSPKQAI